MYLALLRLLLLLYSMVMREVIRMLRMKFRPEIVIPNFPEMMLLLSFWLLLFLMFLMSFWLLLILLFPCC